MADRFRLRKRTPRSPHYPKKVAGYGSFLRRELHKAWKVTSLSVPVDESGMCTVKLEYCITVDIPSVNLQGSGLKGLDRKIVTQVLHGVLIALEEAMSDNTFNLAMNKFISDTLYTRMRMSLLTHGLTGNILKKLTVTHGTPKIGGVASKRVDLSYPLTIRMPFYGAYLDAGRGGAKKAGYKNPITGNSEFYDALMDWVERTLAVPDEDLGRVTTAIYNNINQFGPKTPPRMFLLGSLNYMAGAEVIDHRFESAIEPYLAKHLQKELKNLKV